MMDKLQRWKINDQGVSGFSVTTETIDIHGADWCSSEDVSKLEARIEELEKLLEEKEEIIRDFDENY
jgi:hypothetical protein